MTTKNPVNSVHDEQFDADKKASESAGEEITETTTQEQPAGKTGVENEPVVPEIIEPVTEEPVEELQAVEDTTEEEIAAEETAEEEITEEENYWWGGFDHKEFYDDKVLLFAQELFAGEHTQVYYVRAGTSGEFLSPSTGAEEMYSPEVFGSTSQGYINVK